jgi:small-conductance mechanosensitive channel
MSTPVLTSLLSDLSNDWRDSHLILQVASLAVCALLTWISTHYFNSAFKDRNNEEDAASDHLTLLSGSFARVLWPTLLTLYVALARELLSKTEHTALLKLVFPLAASLALIRFAFYVVRRTFVRDGRIGSFLTAFERLFATIVWLGLALHFTGLWQQLAQGLDNLTLPIGRHKVSLLAIAQALVSVVVTLVIALWASAALEARLMKLPNLHTSLKVVFARLGYAALILVAILFSLNLVGIDLTVLSVFGGALGVGLGLGLQKVTSSYVSGFIILLDRSMAIGDDISVDKYSGKVTKINTRYTVLRGSDGGEAIIPNEMLITTAVHNYSLSDRAVAISTDLTVPYHTDVEKILPILTQAAAQVPRVLQDPAPAGLLTKFGADGFDLKIVFWIADPENGRGNVQSDVNRALWASLQAHQIELPYAQRVVTLINNGQ